MAGVGGIAASSAGLHGRWCGFCCRCWWAGSVVGGVGAGAKPQEQTVGHVAHRILWLGVAFLLAAPAQWLAVGAGRWQLGPGALHALSMGCLASLMLAMVTPIVVAIGGRALVADRIVWEEEEEVAVCLLQLAICCALQPPCLCTKWAHCLGC